MKKMMSSLLVGMLAVGGLGFSVPSTVNAATTYRCDNDPVGYDCGTRIYTGNWIYRSGYSGSQNGDHRIIRDNSLARYSWFYSGHVKTSTWVWLNNIDFTNPAAEYLVNNYYRNSINQNTAPDGWTMIEANEELAREIDVLQQGYHLDSHTGVDMVSMRNSNTLANIDNLKDQTYHANSEIASIQKKMLNAVDHYQNIQGSFHIQFQNNGQNETVEFQVDEEKSPGSHVKVTKSNGDVFETKSNGKEHISMNNEKKQFTKLKVGADNKVFKGPRHFSDEKGKPVFVQRQDPAKANVAKEVTFPQNYAFWLRNKENKIVGHDKMFNRDVTVIEGKHNEYLSMKLGATTYKMWVDTKTGVLLKLIGTNQNGDEAYHINVQDIRFDQGVNAQQFAPVEPKGWEKMKIK